MPAPQTCRVATVEFSVGFNPRIAGIPVSAASRTGNRHTPGWNPHRRVATAEFSRGFQPTNPGHPRIGRVTYGQPPHRRVGIPIVA
jgi:hypothetical protein